jgi:antitoxin StbD
MQKIHTALAASMTDLRDPMKVIKQANGKPFAILKRNQIIGYFVPAKYVETFTNSSLSEEDIQSLYSSRKAVIQPVLDYLKNK